MQAVILAAGMGRRLGEFTSHNTKCMLAVNDRRLIDRMLEQLCRFDLRRIVIVTGYEGRNLREHVEQTHPDLPIVFIDNPIYDKTNNIYSLWLARKEFAADDTILLESDLIFRASVLEALVNSPHKNCALVSHYETWMDGTMVQIGESGDILNFIPKAAFNFSDTESYFKTVNIYKFSREFIENHYLPFLDAYMRVLGENEYYEQVLRVLTLIDRTNIKGVPVSGTDWYEIDDVQDLRIAEILFATPEQKLKKITASAGGYWRYPDMLDFSHPENPFFPTDKIIEEMKANFGPLVKSVPSGRVVTSMLACKFFGLSQGLATVACDEEVLLKSIFGDDERYVLTNPDSIYGTAMPHSELMKLVESCSENGRRLVVDETAIEYAGGEDARSLLDSGLLRKYPSLVVIKSISRAFGVNGLRLCAVASGDSELIERIKRDAGERSINSVAEFFMQIYNKYETQYKVACDKLQAERDSLLAQLEEIAFLKVFPSRSDFILCEVLGSEGDVVERLLAEYDILVRDCTGLNGLPKDRRFFSVAVKTAEENRRLVDALKGLEKSLGK